MNDLLNLKGTFQQENRNSSIGPPSLPSNTEVTVQHMRKLLDELIVLRDYWQKENIITGALISVQYIDVIAKSRRITGFLSKGGITANSSVVGAKFADEETPDNIVSRKHIITHYVSLVILDESIKRLSSSINIVENTFNGIISAETVKEINKKTIDFKPTEIAKTTFLNIVVDCHYVEKFFISQEDDEFKTNTIITIYKTDNTKNVLEKVGINVLPSRIYDETTLLLTPDQLGVLQSKASYLIAMATTDISKLSKAEMFGSTTTSVTIPSPSNEPTIGVIDTMFREDVYFKDWVEFEKKIPDEIELDQKDYFHGTSVSSIIVDGPTINPELDDGCGRFKVRHFGVATSGHFNSFTILRTIDEIVKENRDIKVWNLSLGSDKEIHPNFISPEAAILDKIQSENDVIFIIAGTNKRVGDEEERYIGSPADSINSLVVNSVNYNNKPVSYSRKGPVLSFFNKPDVSYYGGDKSNPIKVCCDTGEQIVSGTSFAAPWIARKMSYLIDVLGLSREVAKALIVDSAASWKKQEEPSRYVGYGVVPIRIEDIIKSQDDEIRFVISGTSEKYNTYNYSLPVPISKDMYPYIAKATLCYFPVCSRNQGVDYTNTELDLHFGRLNGKTVKTINDNKQGEDGSYIYEGNARLFFRKWDNVKHIVEYPKKGARAKKVYDTKMWGLSIKTTERLEEKYGVGLNFGVVITLKEINGVNRIDDFIKQCFLKNWLVTPVNIENRIDIYNIAEEEIEFEKE